MTRPQLLTGIVAYVLLSAPAVAAEPSFEKDVLPILRAHCVSCHGGDKPKAGLDLSTEKGVTAGGKSGAVVKPGSLKESPLWLNVSTDKMPATGPKLTDEEKAVLRTWVAGAKTGTVQPVKPGQKRGVTAAAKAVDDAIEARLAKDGLKPAEQADDSEFLRRVYLDLTGVVPTAEKAVAFLDDTSPDRRARLIDELLASPEHGRFAGEQWAALLSAEEPELRPKLAAWLADQFNRGRGWNAVVSDLIAADGTGPETNFVMAHAENKQPVPEKLAGATARLFLGLQLQCAECHNHPFTEWKQTDFWALAAFYSRARMATKPPAGLSDSETPVIKLPPPKKGEPAVDLSGAVIPIGANAGRAAGKPVRAKFLGGPEPGLDPKGPFRPALAAWITAADNPYFADATVNRVWAELFGRGLVNPVDDLSPENPASHPEVLRALADEFRASGFDRKHLIRCICNSKTYQRTSRGTDTAGEKVYARVPVKVMAPGALYDSLVRTTGVKEVRLDVYLPSGGRGGVTAKRPAREVFVRFFGTRDPDAPGTEYTHGIPQALGLLNGPTFTRPTPVVEQLVKDKVMPEKAVERLYLAALARRPTADETKLMTAYLAKRTDPAIGYAGVLWILLNSPEFVLIR
ncbi:MAG: PSD1 and planctomycete cytochrome C domain-containing protein [Planctomycetes bacterium]|nr:PSD1 and planctomycete cytochrome C domain-containing protein [Planctomycetota bacterium]